MGEAFMPRGGGGAALNFKVLAYATEEALLAATPAENTIGIITETPITSWIFSATEPSPAAAGMVWITTGTSSLTEFNALKKNALQVYPISAKQYVDGAWVGVTAKSYQGGKWVGWWGGELYDHGDQFEEFTGGWALSGAGSIRGSDILVGYGTASSGFGAYAYHKKYISLDGYSQVRVYFTNASCSSSSSCYVTMLIVNEDGQTVCSSEFIGSGQATITNDWRSVDVSSLPSGLYQVRIAVGHSSDSSQWCYAYFSQVECV